MRSKPDSRAGSRRTRRLRTRQRRRQSAWRETGYDRIPPEVRSAWDRLTWHSAHTVVTNVVISSSFESTNRDTIPHLPFSSWLGRGLVPARDIKKQAVDNGIAQQTRWPANARSRLRAYREE